jgi:hypothetical protein
MLERLNGWQRLWIVLSVIYLIVVVAFVIAVMPRASHYARSRLYNSIDTVGRYLERDDASFRYEGGWTMRTKYYADLSDEQVLAKLHDKYKDKVDFDPVESEYRRKMNRRLLEQAQTFGIALLFWLIPVVALYILGVGVAWIIRGFRQPNP